MGEYPASQGAERGSVLVWGRQSDLAGRCRGLSDYPFPWQMPTWPSNSAPE